MKVKAPRRAVSNVSQHASAHHAHAAATAKARRPTIAALKQLMITTYKLWTAKASKGAPPTTESIVDFFTSATDSKSHREQMLKIINSLAHRDILGWLTNSVAALDPNLFATGRLVGLILKRISASEATSSTANSNPSDPPVDHLLPNATSGRQTPFEPEPDTDTDEFEHKYDTPSPPKSPPVEPELLPVEPFLARDNEVTSELDDAHHDRSGKDEVLHDRNANTTAPTDNTSSVGVATVAGVATVTTAGDAATVACNSDALHLTMDQMTIPLRATRSSSRLNTPEAFARLRAFRMQVELDNETDEISNSDSDSDSTSVGGAAATENEREDCPLQHPGWSRPSMDVIANHGPLYNIVPYSAKIKFQNYCAEAFQDYLSANQRNDAEAKLDALTRLLQAPVLVLSKNVKQRSKATNFKHTELQIQTGRQTNSNVEDEDEDVCDVSASSGTDELNDTSEDATAHHDDHVFESNPEAVSKEQARLVNKAVGLIRSSHLSRASKTLCRNPADSPTSANTTAEVVEQFQKLHPRAKSDVSSVCLPPLTSSITINLKDAQEEKQFRKLIQRMADGASPGLSGWTGDMLKEIYPNPTCREGLALLLTDICNGALPDAAKEYLLPSHLVPVLKPNKSIRPISMGEIFYRAAASYIVATVKETAASLLDPIQFGVGKGAGCEQAVHRLQHLLTQDAPHCLAGIAVDFRNAFNERCRADILRELYRYPELQRIWRIVHWAYADPSALWIRHVEQRHLFWPQEELSSEEGVKQGDPLSALLFSLSMKSIYDAAVAAVPTGSVSAVAFLDDCTLVGLPDRRLFQAFEALKSAAKDGGLDINVSKTKLLWLHKGVPLPSSIQSRAAEVGMQVDVGATLLLGTPIGTDIDLMSNMALTLIKEQQSYFNSILAVQMPVQEALTLLRMCAVPRLNYLSRTVHPRVLEPAAGYFDQLMYQTAIQKLQLPMSSTSTSTSTTISSSNAAAANEAARAMKQLRLPIRLSGLGLRSVVESMHFAYLASIIRVAYEDPKWWQERGPNEENNFGLCLQLDQVIQHVQNQLPKQLRKHLCPQTHKHITPFIKQTLTKSKTKRSGNKNKAMDRAPSLLRLQAELTSAFAQSTLTDLKKNTKSNSLDFNRLSTLSQRRTESHTWIQVVARDPSLRMQDHVIRQAVCYRLGLNPYPNLPPVCLCGKDRPYHTNHYHALSCPVLRSRGTNLRHHLIAKNLTTWMRRAGINVEREVEGMSADDNKRPDIVFWNHYQQHVVDVTVTDPLNATNTRRVGSVPSRLTEHAAEQHSNTFDAITEALEKRKHKHYQQLVDMNDAIFHTAAACTTGKLGKQFRHLLDLISSIAQEENGGFDPQEIIQGIRGSVAVAIQVGNAVVMQHSWVALAKRNVSHLLRTYSGPTKPTPWKSGSKKIVRTTASASASAAHHAAPSSVAPPASVSPLARLATSAPTSASMSARAPISASARHCPSPPAPAPALLLARTPMSHLHPDRARLMSSTSALTSSPSSGRPLTQRSLRFNLEPNVDAGQDLRCSSSYEANTEFTGMSVGRFPRVLNATGRQHGEPLKIQTRRGHERERAEAIQGEWIEDGKSEQEGD